MKLVSFNINGIKARGPALTRWLDAFQPDVLVMQEIKSVDDAFPREMFTDRGYHLETHGQKGFNGVAIASKLPLSDVSRGLPGDEDDAGAVHGSDRAGGRAGLARLRPVPTQRQPGGTG